MILLCVCVSAALWPAALFVICLIAESAGRGKETQRTSCEIIKSKERRHVGGKEPCEKFSPTDR